jgi:hypothetical protein
VRERRRHALPIDGLVGGRLREFIDETGLYIPPPSLYDARKVLLRRIFTGEVTLHDPRDLREEAVRIYRQAYNCSDPLTAPGPGHEDGPA